jgi:hypothetical protein
MTNRAFVVGIDDYAGTANDLNSCIQDTVSFERLLSNYYGFSDPEIRRLHNANATLANVREGLEWLIDGAVAGERRVYFHSSHGYHYPKDGTSIEVLVLGDGEFFEDHELVQLTEQLPAGVLTVVIDACHSGGLDKVFLPPNMLVQVARAKVFQPEIAQLDVAAKAINEVTSVKLFGRASTADPGALAKNLALGDADIPPAKDIAAGASELNGVLFSACRADETAAAGTAITSGLSAFTFALTAELDPTISVAELHDRVVQRLKDLRMGQTPVLAVRPDQQDLLSKPFISGQAAPTSTKGKGIKMAKVGTQPASKGVVDLKGINWDEVVSTMKSKDFAPSSAVSAAPPASKDWLDALSSIPWQDVISTGLDVYTALSKSQGVEPEKGWGWFDDIVETVSDVDWGKVVPIAIAAGSAIA